MGDNNDQNVEKNKEKGKNIHVDIIINILSRLPGSSPIRFRCVCKLWRSLTSDPHFIDLHLKHARKVNPPCIITLSKHDQAGEILLLTLLDEAWEAKRIFTVSTTGRLFYMTPSCNGLLCIYNDIGDLVQLCNPTTRESLTLPRPTLGTYPYFTTRCYFGFHPATKEYKVVHIFSRDPEQESYDLQCEVFTLGTGLWRLVCNIDYLPCGRGITLNGVMYWLTSSRDTNNAIVSLDLKDEQFIPISSPNFEGYKNKMHEPKSLVELEGNVCLAISPYGAPASMDIWMLKDCIKHVWIHKYRILVHTRLENQFWCPAPLFIQKGKILVKSCQKLCYHNLESMSEKYEEVYYDEQLLDASVHVESLVSLTNR